VCDQYAGDVSDVLKFAFLRDFAGADRTLGIAWKHATFTEIRLLREPGRAIVVITIPGRNLKHDALLRQLHERLSAEVGAETVITLRTNVSVPRSAGSSSYVQRQRWFTVVEPDDELTARARAFAIALASVPRVRARLERIA
jgi:hypothetical protein